MAKRWYEISATIELPDDDEITIQFNDEICNVFEKYGDWVALRLSPIKEDEEDVV